MDFERYSLKHVQFNTQAQLPALLDDWLAKRKGKIDWLVDVGCGDGAFIAALPRLAATHVLGIDLSPIRLQRLKKRRPDITTCQADALSLPIADSTVQFIICNQVIEHVPSDEELLRELYRVLKPRGGLWISSVLRKRWAWYIYKNQWGKWVLDPTHVREYKNREEFTQLVAHNGFVVIVSSVEPLRFPVVDLFYKLLIRLGLLIPERAVFAFDKCPGALQRLRATITLPVLGYSQISVLAQKRE
jgi:ubiquinone/menaquinone biosynthesis C-methylase UbiE